MKKFIIISFAVTAVASSQAAYFDWENLATGYFASVSQTDSGVTATATHVSTTGQIESANHMGAGLAPFQTRALLARDGANFGDIRIDFDALMTSVSIQVGDNNADDDGPIQLFAYTSGNALVDSDSIAYGAAMDTPVTLSVAGANIAYIIGTGGGNFPGSLYWDNVTANPVPEPATMTLLGLGAVAIMRRRKK